MATQAVQWFDRPAFYREAFRLLNDGGLVALLENNRDWRNSAFLDDYETFLETHSIKDDGSHYSRFYRDHPYRVELGELFAHVEEHHAHWSRTMKIADFIGMARSSTQVQRIVKRRGGDFLEATLRELLYRHFPSGAVEVPYDTVLFVGQKTSQR